MRLHKIQFIWNFGLNNMAREAKNKKEVVSKIAQKVKQLRLDANYTSAESFAYDKGLNRVQYWRVESGANVTLNTLLIITDIHQISLSKFFEGI